MVQTTTKSLSLDVIDQPNEKLLVPEFAQEFQLTLQDLFDWLLD